MNNATMNFAEEATNERYPIDITFIINLHNYLNKVENPSTDIINARKHLEQQLLTMVSNINIGVFHGQKPNA